MKILILFLVNAFNYIFPVTDWNTIHTSKEVTIRYREADCLLDNSFKQRWFILEFKNQTSNKIKIEWDLELFDENGKCVTCNSSNNEYHQSIVLNSLESKVGECNFACPLELRIVSKLLDVNTSSSYPSFKLTNVKVTKL